MQSNLGSGHLAHGGQGGGGNGGAINPFTAIGLESLINIKDKMSARRTPTKRSK